MCFIDTPDYEPPPPPPPKPVFRTADAQRDKQNPKRKRGTSALTIDLDVAPDKTGLAL